MFKKLLSTLLMVISCNAMQEAPAVSSSSQSNSNGNGQSSSSVQLLNTNYFDQLPQELQKQIIMDIIENAVDQAQDIWQAGKIIRGYAYVNKKFSSIINSLEVTQKIIELLVNKTNKSYEGAIQSYRTKLSLTSPHTPEKHTKGYKQNLMPPAPKKRKSFSGREIMEGQSQEESSRRLLWSSPEVAAPQMTYPSQAEQNFLAALALGTRGAIAWLQNFVIQYPDIKQNFGIYIRRFVSQGYIQGIYALLQIPGIRLAFFKKEHILQLAVNSYNVPMVKFLLENGADVNEKGLFGQGLLAKAQILYTNAKVANNDKAAAHMAAIIDLLRSYNAPVEVHKSQDPWLTSAL